MLTYLTSVITLNQFKGPNNPIFVFTNSCLVRQHVLEALEEVSSDSELTKYEQKTTIFSTFSSSFNRSLQKFFRTKVYPKRLWNICYVNGTWTFGITLNQIKGPNNPIFDFNYSCAVRQDVLEALEDVSCDSELIKHDQKTTIFFYFFKFIQSTPTDFFQD